MRIRWSEERTIKDRIRLRDKLIKNLLSQKDDYRILDVNTCAWLQLVLPRH